jgi:hypothetical protein
MLSVAFYLFYTECRYAECRGAQCRGAHPITVAVTGVFCSMESE